MEVTSQSADKAVSTEDLCLVTRDINLEVARLEAMLNTLVENKVEAMKADKIKPCNDQVVTRVFDKRMQRIASSSTASSSNKDRYHRHKHHSHRDHEHKRRTTHEKRYGHSRCRVSSNSPESPRSPRTHHTTATTVSQQRRLLARSCCEHAIASASNDEDDIDPDLDVDAVNDTFDFLAYTDHRTYMTVCDPELNACSCPDNHNGQIIKLPYDDDYVSINIDDFENVVEEDAIISHDALRRARRKRRKRRKKRRKRLQRQQLAMAAAAQAVTVKEKVKVIDPDDLPQRARWTIVATACLLLLMCLLLVGVTLRMAPIIDDMVRKENEELMNSLNRESSGYNSSYTAHMVPQL